MRTNGSRKSWMGVLVLTMTVGGSAAGAQGYARVPAPGGPLMLVGAGQGTSSPVKDDLFAGTEKFAKGASDVTEVSMDPDTLDMVSGKDARRAHDMVLNVVRSYEYDKPGMYNIADVEEFRKRLETGDWHCSVHTADLKHGESTDICRKHRTDGLLEQAIITVEPKQLTFIHTIRRPHAGGEDGGGGESMLGFPAGFKGSAAMEPKLAVQLALTEAHFAASQPGMTAAEEQMQAVAPEIQAQMAGVRERLANLTPPRLPDLDRWE